MTLRSAIGQMLYRLGESMGGRDTRQQLDDVKMLSAKVLIQCMRDRGQLVTLKDAEFKVFSQFGDDGIIQHLIRETKITPSEESFIEFGVQNYDESNTRFLLMNDNWRGMIIDGDSGNIAYVRRSNYFWKHDLSAVAAFINRDNINALLTEHGFAGKIGLLSIDIDGNDYWVWDRIDCVDSVIVIVEYNSIFGRNHAVTIPYDASFQRAVAHYSNLYWGASLNALCYLAARKGYVFVGCNSAGNNAYFVRQDRLGRLRPQTSEEGYVDSHFRESRDRDGRLTLLKGDDRLREISNLEIFDVEHDRLVKVQTLIGNNDG